MSRGNNIDELFDSRCLSAPSGNQSGLSGSYTREKESLRQGSPTYEWDDPRHPRNNAPPISPKIKVKTPRSFAGQGHGLVFSSAGKTAMNDIQNRLLGNADEALREIVEYCERLAKKYCLIPAEADGSCRVPGRVLANTKGGERASEKVENDYGGDWFDIKDLARLTIVVPYESIPDVQSQVARHYALSDRAPQIKTTLPSENSSFTATLPGEVVRIDDCGYSGRMVVVYTKANSKEMEFQSGKKDVVQLWMSAEIQINSKEMIYAKHEESETKQILTDDVYEEIRSSSELDGGAGHHLYEIYRDPHSSDELKRKAAEVSKLYYDYFRRGAEWWSSEEGMRVVPMIRQKMAELEKGSAVQSPIGQPLISVQVKISAEA